MSHYKANVRDLEFNLFEVLDLGTLLDRGAYGDLDSDTAKAMLTEVAHFAQEVVAESFVEADRNPVRFIPAEHTITVPDALRKTVAAVHAAGWSALGIPEGIGAPAPRGH
jgi:Acyl-CoA dehydrogenase N terminal